MTDTRKANIITTEAKLLLESTTVLQGILTRDAVYDAVEKAVDTRKKQNGEIWTRYQEKLIQEDSVERFTSVVIGQLLRKGTNALLDAFVDGVPISDHDLMVLRLEVSNPSDDSGKERILVPLGLAEGPMIEEKMQRVKENWRKQGAQVSRFEEMWVVAKPYYNKGYNTGDAMRQMQLIFEVENQA